MPHARVLFTTERSPYHQQANLRAAPPELDVVMLRHPARAELLQQLPDFDFLLSERQGTIDAEIIAAGRKLKLIQRLGSLPYDIDLAAAQSAGIPITCWPLLTCIHVSEHMILQMLGLARRILEVNAVATSGNLFGRQPRRTDENTFAYNWSGRQHIRRVYGSTAGILGFGEIGAELARRLRGFGVTTLYNRRTHLPAHGERDLNVIYAEKENLLSNSNFVFSLFPYTPETAGYFNRQRLALLRPGSYLIHAGSGGIIDEAALVEALDSGHLAGAALDTYDWEPPHPTNPLLKHARALLTPHVAAGTETLDGRSAYYRNCLNILGSKPLENRIG